MPPCPVRDAGGRGCGVTTGYITPGIQIGDVERLNVSSALQWRPNDRTEVVLDLFTGRGGRTLEELWSKTGSQATWAR